MYEILIVGGGPAGLTAAIYAARAGKHVAVLERGSTGGQIISAPLVENYPGIPSVSGTELARQMTEQACTFGAEIVYTEAVGLEKTPAGFRVLCMDGVREAKGHPCDWCGAPVTGACGGRCAYRLRRILLRCLRRRVL